MIATIGHERQRASTSDTTGKKASRSTRRRGISFSSTVIWFFDRDGERLRYEITRDRAANRYRLVITRPDGSESIEEVNEPTELVERSVELMNSLRSDGWRVA